MTVRAGIGIGPGGLIPLLPTVDQHLIRVVVDQHLHLPDMFELTFIDDTGTIVGDSLLELGTEVWIFGGTEDDLARTPLICGEITAIEGVYEDVVMKTVIRGYDKSHRMQRVRKTRTFGVAPVPMPLSVVVTQICGEYAPAIVPGEIHPAPVMHDQIDQVNETDWDFLKRRAAEIGYEFGTEVQEPIGCKMYFRQAPGLGPMGTITSTLGQVEAGIAEFLPLAFQLRFKENLLSFRPRLTAAGLPSKVEVRVWDPQNADVLVGKADVASKTAILEDDAAALAGKFPPGGMPTLPSIPGLSLGPAPGPAYVVVDRPVAGVGLVPPTQAVQEVADGVAEHIGSAFAEAEGLAEGNPKIAAGKYVPIYGVAREFSGAWYITNATHVFDEEDGGYRTRFVVSGRAERSLLGMAQGGGGGDSFLGSVVCGVVTDVLDIPPLGAGLNRVKVAFPWLHPGYVSNWARVVNFGSGKAQGSLFTPEVGDEVLVAFEMGDIRRPYVLGGLQNKNTNVEYGGLGGMQVSPLGLGGKVAVRGFVTRIAKLLIDDMPLKEGGLTPSLVLGMNNEKQMLKIDQKMGTIDLICEPSPPDSAVPMGKIAIKVNALGEINIEAGPTGKITLKTGPGGKIAIGDPTSEVEISGSKIKIAGTALTEISGAIVKIN